MRLVLRIGPILFALFAAKSAITGDVRAGESSFRCGTHLVTLGASRKLVRSACGEPTTARLVQTNLAGLRGARLHVEQELWTYDFGPLQFTWALTFSGDDLEAIERRDYGH